MGNVVPQLVEHEAVRAGEVPVLQLPVGRLFHQDRPGGGVRKTHNFGLVLRETSEKKHSHDNISAAGNGDVISI